MMYITEHDFYFYSPFNESTLLGKGSKIKIPYADLKSISKELTLLIFPDAIRFTFKSGDSILFKSFL
jgi:hypothetical protein